MEEIKELDNKYLVLKWDDIEKYLTPRGLKKPLLELDGIIALSRKLEGKSNENRYLVLNLDDEFSIPYLNAKIQEIIVKRMHAVMFENKHNEPLYIRDIAVDLVNSILKAKEKEQ